MVTSTGQLLPINTNKLPARITRHPLINSRCFYFVQIGEKGGWIMWKNFKLNHQLIISGFETLFLGAYLIYVQNLFTVPPRRMHRFGQIAMHAQDPMLAVILIVVGSFAVVVGLWNVREFFVNRVTLVAMIGVWSAYFVVFFWHDLNRPGPLGFATILIGFVIVRLFVESRWGDSV